MNKPAHSILDEHLDDGEGLPPATLQKLAAAASFLMAVAILAAHWIYLSGNLDEPAGPYVYSLADFLYGPVFGAGLVMAVYALRERIGRRAPRLMNLALLLALAVACAFLTVASVRAANRYYHLSHPDLNLESSTTILVVWATLVSGIIGAAFHFLGWAFVLTGVAGWTSRRLPRVLSGLYALGGIVALVVYAFPPAEGTALLLILVISVWQGILLWRGWPAETRSPDMEAGALDQA